MVYNKLGIKSLEEILDSLYTNKPKPQERRIVFYTGLVGALTFDFVLQFGGTIESKHYTSKFKHIPGIRFISLFKKEGLYKIVIKGHTFIFYKGTVKINTIYNVFNEFNIKGTAGVDPEKIKSGIDKVNNYINKLN